MSKHFPLFIKSLLLLTIIAFFDRMLFIGFNQGLINGIEIKDVLHSAYWGLRFDASVSAFLALFSYLVAYIVGRLLKGNFLDTLRHALYASVTSLIMLEGADIIYFMESNHHLGYEALNWHKDTIGLILTAINTHLGAFFLHLFLILVALVVVWWIFCPVDDRLIFSTRKGWASQPELQLLLTILISIVLIRGGFQAIPLEPLHAQEIGDRQKAALALNGAYNALFFSVTHNEVRPIKLSIDSKIDTAAIFNKLYANNSNSLEPQGEFKPYNIVLILLEGWSASLMGSYGYERNMTPYFDALRSLSLTTYVMLAGGHRTTEGMFATLCSAQNPLGQTVAQSQLQNFEYLCLPHLLRAKGYSTAFFQGSQRNTSGTGAFAQLLGFSDSYGKVDVKQREYEENSRGVHDPDLYKFVLSKTRKLHKPFFVGINTNSTHDQQLPNGVEPVIKPDDKHGMILNMIHFADKALGSFIDTAQSDLSLANTIFVLVGDHTANVHSSNFNKYSVPFLIYAPNIVARRFVVRAASQRDIVPTLLDITGHSPIAQFTGKSLLEDDNGPYFADYYHDGILGWIEDDLLVEIPVTDSSAISCYDYRNDPLLKSPIQCQEKSLAMTHRALSFTKTVQQYLFSGKLRMVNEKENTDNKPLTQL